MSEGPAFIDEERDGVTIVYSMSKWMIEPRMAEVLTRHLIELLDAGSDRVLLNFNDVTRLSSVFIRSIMAAGKRAQEKRAELCLCNIAPVVREVFTLTGVDKMFRTFSTEQEALMALGGQ